LTHVNLLGLPSQPNYSSYVERCIKEVNPHILSFDNYPTDDQPGRDGFSPNLRIFRDVCATHGQPFWTIVDAFPPVPGGKPVAGSSVEHLRWQVMETVRYGASGVMYFTYWTPADGGFDRIEAMVARDGKLTPRYYEVRALNEDLRVLTDQTGEVLFGRVRGNVNGDLWLLDSAHPETHRGPKWDCANMPSPSDPATSARRLACSQTWEQMKLHMPGYGKVAALDQAPEGMNGFYLAARNDFVGRTFHVLNVVSNAGTLYEVSLGKYPKSLGPAGWDDPRRKHIVGMAFEVDGFWVSIED